MPASSSIDDLARQAQFIFTGTVSRLNAVTVAALEPNPNTAVVRVDEVVQAPPALGDQTGKEITVWLKRPGTVVAGQQALFFTNGWLFGETIAVQEVAHRKPRASTTRTRNRVVRVAASMEDEALRSQIDQGNVVIVGRVAALREAPAPQVAAADAGDIVPRLSEHDPQWWEAVIDVDDVVAGNVEQEGQVTVMYPNSDDVMWRHTPKFQAGQEGVWILHKEQVRALAREAPANIAMHAIAVAEGTGAYTALDPMDFQPLDQLDRIKAAARRNG